MAVTVIALKIELYGFTMQICIQKDAEEIANSVGAYQTAPLAVWAQLFKTNDTVS